MNDNMYEIINKLLVVDKKGHLVDDEKLDELIKRVFPEVEPRDSGAVFSTVMRNYALKIKEGAYCSIYVECDTMNSSVMFDGDAAADVLGKLIENSEYVWKVAPPEKKVISRREAFFYCGF
ncbi:MAG: hypothetical protein ACP5N2_03360 [Candidatus Nanoarchaeia archaeon]